MPCYAVAGCCSSVVLLFPLVVPWFVLRLPWFFSGFPPWPIVESGDVVRGV